jgi:hypothetical protein
LAGTNTIRSQNLPTLSKTSKKEKTLFTEPGEIESTQFLYIGVIKRFPSSCFAIIN